MVIEAVFEELDLKKKIFGDLDRIVAAIRAAREQVGPNGVVMFDAHCAVPPATLQQFTGSLERKRKP